MNPSLLFFLYCRFSLFLKDPFFPDYFVISSIANLGVGRRITTVPERLWHELAFQSIMFLKRLSFGSKEYTK